MMFNNDSDKYFTAEWLMTIDDDHGQRLIMLDGFNINRFMAHNNQ